MKSNQSETWYVSTDKLEGLKASVEFSNKYQSETCMFHTDKSEGLKGSVVIS